MASQADRGVAFVRILSTVLTRLVQANDSMAPAPTPETITRFHALEPPPITIGDYLERVLRYSGCSAEVFLLALVYVDRLINKTGLTLTSLNVHRVLITAIMLGAKFFDDHYFNNAYFGRVGGVPTGELNSLEIEFLFGLNFQLHVNGSEFNRYYKELAGHLVMLGPSPDVPQLQHILDAGPYALEDSPAAGAAPAPAGDVLPMPPAAPAAQGGGQVGGAQLREADTDDAEMK